MASIVDKNDFVWEHFTPYERQHLLDEDSSAWRAISGILLAIVTAGMLAVAVTVLCM